MNFKIIWFILILECHRAFAKGLGPLILEAHNRRRAKYGHQPMTLDEKLSEGCKKHAEKIIDDRSLVGPPDVGDDPLHGMGPIDGKYTQNICIFRNALPRSCVREWFHYRGYDDDWKYYQFTAMIWNASTNLGVGVAKRKQTRCLVVRYVPPGNILKEMRYNVPSRIKDPWDEEEAFEGLGTDEEDEDPDAVTNSDGSCMLFDNCAFFLWYVLIIVFVW
ncbi:secreted protein RBT4 [Drosophila ficusphila]|uniref:secreted protein RBT4 n=1 Tax=Drosophila ficusphila TaxID=30025 RepID=UPI0007E883B0|nr:secreted protein RBT4 [Drosophila ficusphila]